MISITMDIADHTQASADALHYLHPRKHDFNVEIEINLSLEDDGGCYVHEDTIYIEAKNLLGLAHELVHASQIIKGHLELNLRKWKGKSYLHSKIEPWEQQAYGLEQKILKNFLLKNQ